MSFFRRSPFQSFSVSFPGHWLLFLSPAPCQRICWRKGHFHQGRVHMLAASYTSFRMSNHTKVYEAKSREGVLQGATSRLVVDSIASRSILFERFLADKETFERKYPKSTRLSSTFVIIQVPVCSYRSRPHIVPCLVFIDPALPQSSHVPQNMERTHFHLHESKSASKVLRNCPPRTSPQLPDDGPLLPEPSER